MSLRGVKIGDWLIVNGPLRRPSEARLIQGTAITESTKVVAGGMKFRRDGTLFSITRMPKLFAQPALPQQVKPIKQKGA